MIEKGEKTCPLCAEEMDLTDQYLKPCKCGYQICLWCWHHITEMAEKEKPEGRCPACRTTYDKEKIVASCERLAAELNNDRKKSQKGKAKSSEGKKDLNGVRVIQRKLVYVLSWPLELADEDRLQRKEYFGQYGKVVKVAMSRTAAGAVQQFPNNTCSVYITYSKEEEAIRCIQSVQGFVLNGRNLKACFGTMKYCHAWLRNMPCTNSECLYLHEIGSQEDSFTKDETISVHMRRIVQEITGPMEYSMRRGSILPPPADEYVDNESCTRKSPKSVLNNAHSFVKSSPPDGSIDRSVTLPAGALWGMHSSSQSSVASTGTTKSMQISASHNDVTKKPALEYNHTANGNALKPQEPLDDQADFPELSLSNRPQISNRMALGSASVDNSRAVSVPSDCTNFPELISRSNESVVSNGNKEINTRIQSVCSDPVPVDADSVADGYRGQTSFDSSHFDHASLKPSHSEVSQDSLQHCVNEAREVQPLQKSGQNNTKEVNARSALMSLLVTDRFPEAEDDISLFNRQRLEDPEVPSCQPNMANKSGFLGTSNCTQPCVSQYKAEHDESRTVFGSSISDNRGSNTAPISHGYTEMPFSNQSHLNGSLHRSVSFPDKARDTQPTVKSFANSQENSTSEMEDRIIANILSLDLDEYLSSPQNFTKTIGAGDIVERSLKPVGSNIVNDNQSRFSFARQEVKDQAESYNASNQISHDSDFYQNSSKQPSPDMNMLGMNNGFSSSYLKGMDYAENSSLPSSLKIPSVARGPVPAPPGFSVLNRPPPPGFSSTGRVQLQAFDNFSGNHRHSDSSLFGNPYQSLPVENTGSIKDVQFMDPAIMAVGQGYNNGSLNFRSNYRGNTNMYGNEAKLQQRQQMVMQSPLSSLQNCRFTDSLGMASRLQDQSQGSNILSRNLGVPVANGHWDGLSNEIQSRNRLQNERLIGATNGIPGYNGTFRI